jgi:hypothetical protein
MGRARGTRSAARVWSPRGSAHYSRVCRKIDYNRLLSTSVERYLRIPFGHGPRQLLEEDVRSGSKRVFPKCPLTAICPKAPPHCTPAREGLSVPACERPTLRGELPFDRLCFRTGFMFKHPGTLEILRGKRLHSQPVVLLHMRQFMRS